MYLILIYDETYWFWDEIFQSFEHQIKFEDYPSKLDCISVA